jgi:hypothetical protein
VLSVVASGVQQFSSSTFTAHKQEADNLLWYECSTRGPPGKSLAEGVGGEKGPEPASHRREPCMVGLLGIIESIFSLLLQHFKRITVPNF